MSAESFDHFRKTTLVDVGLPTTSAAIQGDFLQVYYSTNISIKIVDTTKPTLQLLNFCLHEILKKFLIKCACKTSFGDRSSYKKREYLCTEFLKYQNCENIQLSLIDIC